MDHMDKLFSARLDGMERLLADLGDTDVDAAALIHGLQQAGWTPPGGCVGGLSAPPAAAARPGSTMTATDYLQAAANEMHARAQVRDTPQGERSMGGAVAAFNAIYGAVICERVSCGLPPLTETHGWELQSLLKKSRSAQGAYHEDDYTDDVGYVALAAECAAREAL